MGTNTLVDRTQGTITSDWFNQFITALKGDIVPRQNGAPTTEAGSFGNNTFRFLNHYIASGGKCDINSNYLKETSGVLKIADDGTSEKEITTNFKNNVDLNAAFEVSDGGINLGAFNDPDLTSNATVNTNIQEVANKTFRGRRSSASFSSITQFFGTDTNLSYKIVAQTESISFYTPSGFAFCSIRGTKIGRVDASTVALGLYDTTNSRLAVGGMQTTPLGVGQNTIECATGVFYAPSAGTYTLNVAIIHHTGAVDPSFNFTAEFSNVQVDVIGI